ncbi:MAG TPA: A/G-specific adenine glycosylase [Candidatus Paceibacterota bacterium]
MNPQKRAIAKFKETIWDYYEKNGRHSLPWRKTRDPYEILVSEIMLQQTQVSRVTTKWSDFLAKFPTAAALADASVPDVLKMWQGLGYNRRALNLKRAAETVMRDFGGKFPKMADELESLSGIGQSTRGAIMAFAFGLPTPFIETNIRAIYIHHFFGDSTRIHDRDLMPLIEETLDQKNPRDWYYALMDYGVHLKQTLPNPSRKSAHHARQSSFKGSNREVRSRILKLVLAKTQAGAAAPTRAEIIAHIGKTEHDVDKNIDSLVKEGFMDEPIRA